MKKILLSSILLILCCSCWAQSYRLPFVNGTTRTCTQGNSGSTSHSGIEQYAFDFSMPIGTAVVAVRSGTIQSKVETWTDGNCPYSGGCSGCVNNVNRIVVNHGDGTYALYLHLTLNGSIYNVGDYVTQGQVIGYSGNTGCSTGAHLHFMLMNSGASWYSQSIPISFCDVSTNGGVPVSGSSYTANSCINVSLNSPSNGASNVNSPITFSWNATSGADAYRINVATSTSGFNSTATPMFPSALVNQNGTSSFTSFTWTGASPGITYYWVVRANVPGLGSAVSEIRSFTTSSSAGPSCSGQTNLTASTGSFTDGSGANNYGDNSNCSWLIQPSGASSITLNFSAFNTELGYDYVRVYDGTSSSAALLGSFSGTSIPSSITSSGGSMFVQFTSDGSQQAAGWAANYTSATGGGGAPPPCSGGVQYPSIILTPTSSWQTQGSIYAGEYSVHNVVNGQTYIWSLCPVDGGNASYDAQLTLRNNSTLAYIAYSDDVCGDDPSITWTANFTGQVRVLVNQYTCLTNSISTTLAYKTNCVPPSQPLGIGGNTAVCQGSSQTYIVGGVSGATSYTWTIPSGWSGSSSGNSIVCTPGINGGTISVTANNSCGTSNASSIYTTVSSLPSQPNSISGFLSICQGTTQTYSIPAVAGATSYSWSLPSGWSGSSTSTSITCNVGASSGNVSVSANNGCGTSNASTIYTTVSALPAQPSSISGNSSVCQGSSQTYSTPSVAGATSYSWSLPSGWSGSSTSTSITCTVGASAGNVSVSANNGCGAGMARTLAITVSSQPSQPNTISGFLSVCQGTTQTYSIPAVSGATSYSWSLPSGWSGSSTSTSITCTVGASSGNVSVSANNGCGTGTARTLAITVSSLPSQPNTISGFLSVCQGSSQTYSIPAVAGATSYSWSLPSGWSGSSTSTSITCTVGATGGNLAVSANNGCGTGTARILGTSVSALPAQPSSISGNSSVCQGSSQTYSTPSVAGATSYSWILPSGWSGSSTGTSITCTVGTSGGNLAVSANNGCGTGAGRVIVVSLLPFPNVNINSPATTICQGTSLALTASGATSYIWSPSGVSGASINVSPTTSTTYTVTGTNANGCTATATRVITVTSCSTTLNLKCYISGYYIGGGFMTKVLQNQSVAGATSTMTDTILIQLRNASWPYGLAATQKRILNTNGTSSGLFNLTGNYYVVVKQRNGIQTWSANSITLSGGTVTYDFSNLASKAYGSNQVAIGGGLFAFYSGDINQDENIDLLDAYIEETDIDNFLFGYINSDLNGDGNVDLLDLPILEQNVNSFIFSTHP